MSRRRALTAADLARAASSLEEVLGAIKRDEITASAEERLRLEGALHAMQAISGGDSPHVNGSGCT